MTSERQSAQRRVPRGRPVRRRRLSRPTQTQPPGTSHSLPQPSVRLSPPSLGARLAPASRPSDRQRREARHPGRRPSLGERIVDGTRTRGCGQVAGVRANRSLGLGTKSGVGWLPERVGRTKCFS